MLCYPQHFILYVGELVGVTGHCESRVQLLQLFSGWKFHTQVYSSLYGTCKFAYTEYALTLIQLPIKFLILSCSYWAKKTTLWAYWNEITKKNHVYFSAFYNPWRWRQTRKRGFITFPTTKHNFPGLGLTLQPWPPKIVSYTTKIELGKPCIWTIHNLVLDYLLLYVEKLKLQNSELQNKNSWT